MIDSTLFRVIARTSELVYIDLIGMDRVVRYPQPLYDSLIKDKLYIGRFDSDTQFITDIKCAPEPDPNDGMTMMYPSTNIEVGNTWECSLLYNILKSLHNRCGFTEWWMDIDPVIQEEIINDLIYIIR
jgi:hypothetical protein